MIRIDSSSFRLIIQSSLPDMFIKMCNETRFPISLYFFLLLKIFLWRGYTSSLVEGVKDLIARFKYDLKVLQIKLYNAVYRRYFLLVDDP